MTIHRITGLMSNTKAVHNVVYNYVIPGLVIAGLSIGGVIVTSLIVRYTPDMVDAANYLYLYLLILVL